MTIPKQPSSCDKPKPPMVVWVYTSPSSPDDMGGWFKNQNSMETLHGPYVHLDQFLEEAKKRAKKQNRFLPEVMDIMQKELNEEKHEQTI